MTAHGLRDFVRHVGQLVNGLQHTDTFVLADTGVLVDHSGRRP